MGRRRAMRHGNTATERSIRVRALLSAGMVLGLGAVGTLAAWTDESTATATFSAGTLDLKLRELPGGTFADSFPSVTSLNMTDMYPGVSKAAVVQLSNSGSVPLSYTMLGSAVPSGTSSLGQALQVSAYSSATVGGTAPNESCTGGTLMAGPVTLTSLSVAGLAALTPGGTENICLVVSLPSDAATTLQGTSTTATFTFSASIGS